MKPSSWFYYGLLSLYFITLKVSDVIRPLRRFSFNCAFINSDFATEIPSPKADHSEAATEAKP